MIRKVFFISFLLFVFCAHAASEEKKTYVKTRTDEMKKVFAGQRIPFYVTLSAQSRFTGSSRFDIPDVPGVIIMEVEDRPVLGSTKENGIEFLTKTHEFAIFPQTHGEFVIPAFPVSFAYVNISTNKTVEGTYQTNEFSVSVQRPEGTEAVDHFISTVQFTVKETWKPTPENPKVGDAFVRSIIRTAKDIPGMVFQPIKPEKIQGIGIYQEPPQVQDRMQRGDFTGTRTETITYVCESEGRFDIPGLQFYWFDLKSGTLKEETLPAVVLDVALSPLLFNEEVLDGQQSVQPFSVSRNGVMTFACLLLLVFVIFIYKNSILIAWSRYQKEKALSEKTLFNKFKFACHSGNDLETLIALIRWLEILIPENRTIPVKSILQSFAQDELLKEFKALEKRLYGPVTQKNEITDSNQKLFAFAKKFRKRVIKEHQQKKISDKGLQLFNP